MKTARRKKLTAKAAGDLLSSVPHRRDAAMSREFMGEFFVLDDGGAVFLDSDGTGLHFYSYDEVVTLYWDDVRHAKEHKGSVAELLPDITRFIADLPALIAELPAALNVKPELLDFSEDSLDLVDSAIRRLGRQRILAPKIFAALTGYVGEVIRRHVEGAWAIRDVGNGVSEPDIVDATGSGCSLLRLYKELLEHGRRASMRAFVRSAIVLHAPPPRDWRGIRSK
jgi:hypothetical protein